MRHKIFLIMGPVEYKGIATTLDEAAGLAAKIDGTLTVIGESETPDEYIRLDIRASVYRSINVKA